MAARDDTLGPYRRIYVRMWADRRFLALTRPQPNAQSLWVYLLTGKHTCRIPGVVLANRAELAAALHWPLQTFGVTFAELSREGLVVAMPEGPMEPSLMWVPSGPKNNKPDNQNHVAGWAKSWPQLPDCEMKHVIYRGLESYLRTLPPTFLATFYKTFEATIPTTIPPAGTGTGTGEVHTCPDPPVEAGGSSQPSRRKRARVPPKPEPPEAVALADQLRAELREALPAGSTAVLTDAEWQRHRTRASWAKTFRLCVELDRATYEQLHSMIHWLFHSDNMFSVQSADSLRRKRDSVLAAMKKAGVRVARPNGAADGTWDVDAQVQRELEREGFGR